MTVKDYFKVLELTTSANEDEIKKAYRRLAKIWHPDKNSSAEATEKFKEINAAYETLKSENRRYIHISDLNHSKKDSNKSDPKTNTKSNYSSTFKTYSDTKNESDSGTKSKSGTSSTKDKKRCDSPDDSYSYEDYFKSKSGQQNPKHSRRKSDFGTYKSTTNSTPRSKPKPKPKTKFWDGSDTHFTFDHDPNFTYTSDGKGFSFNFGGFKVFMNDSNLGFTTFCDPRDPFRDFNTRDDLPGFSFDDFSDEESQEFEERYEKEKNRKHKAKTLGKDNGGNPEWYDWSKGGENADDESYDWDDDTVDMSCNNCGQRMDGNKLRKHEPKCRRYSTGSLNTFTMPGNGGWRDTHDEFISQIRQAKQTNKTSRQNSINSDTVICPACYRSFQKDVAAKHIPFCQRTKQEKGKPMNPFGRSAEARDYGSKGFAAREYAKNIPKPKPKTQQGPPKEESFYYDDDDYEDDFEDSPTPQPRASKSAFSRNTSKPTRIPSRGQPKPKIDVNIPPTGVNGTAFKPSQPKKPSDAEGCENCIGRYGPRAAKFVCSCGVKKSAL